MQKASFDTYASDYDTHFTFSEIGKLQRQVVFNKLVPFLNKQHKVVEVNCGTGFDAFELAQKVNTYLATDVSEKMIALCQSKLHEKNIPNLQFKCTSIQNISDEMKGCNFVFSDFGGLNCLSPDELLAFAGVCSKQLPTHSDLFFVIMGRKCIWERFYFVIKGEFKKAFRRSSKTGVHTKINEQEFTTWYYSPKEIERLFRPYFKCTHKGAIAVFVPPSYLNSFFENKKKGLRFLAYLDRIFTTFNWTANYADHYFIHLKKQD
jgi:SAM-dependent methyltransferase